MIDNVHMKTLNNKGPNDARVLYIIVSVPSLILVENMFLFSFHYNCFLVWQMQLQGTIVNKI